MKADHTIPQGKPTCNNRRTVHRTKLPYDKSNLRELSYRILANRSSMYARHHKWTDV